MSKRQQGVVKWFNVTKGFGFVHCNNEDVFIHYTDIIASPGAYRCLKAGQHVSYELKDSPQGLAAKYVLILDDATKEDFLATA